MNIPIDDQYNRTQTSGPVVSANLLPRLFLKDLKTDAPEQPIAIVLSLAAGQ